MKYERFGRFVRDRRGRILFFLFCAAALSASFALYRLPLAAVAYPMGLAAAAGGACLLLGWRRQRRRCTRLAEILCRPASEIENLPAAICDYERALQDALCALAKRYCALERESATRQDDMADYYTLWAHQIKTPISAMRLTLHGEGGAQARRLSAQLTRIEQYVDMVLAYQRLESASTDYVFAPIALDDAVRAVGAPVRGRIHRSRSEAGLQAGRRAGAHGREMAGLHAGSADLKRAEIHALGRHDH